MLKIMAPAAILVACLSVAPAEARICPVGQIFRIKLGICAPRAQNLKWLHVKSSLNEKKVAVKRKAAPKIARAAPLKFAPAPKAVIDPNVIPAPVNTPAPAALAPQEPAQDPLVEAPSPSQTQSQGSSPYGSLRSNLF